MFYGSGGRSKEMMPWKYAHFFHDSRYPPHIEHINHWRPMEDRIYICTSSPFPFKAALLCSPFNRMGFARILSEWLILFLTLQLAPSQAQRPTWSTLKQMIISVCIRYSDWGNRLFRNFKSKAIYFEWKNELNACGYFTPVRCAWMVAKSMRSNEICDKRHQ